jgi:hypothetical protein
MDMGRKVLLVAFFFPMLAFAVAGFIELRSSRKGTEKLRNLIPIILGIAAFGLSFNPQALFGGMTTTPSATLSQVMTVLSAGIAASGLFISYSRRASTVWVAVGGSVLALLWWFNRIAV